MTIMESTMTNANSIQPTRRGVVGGIGFGLAASAVGAIAPVNAQTLTKTFVLVHGAWHGGWCWRRVADLLEAKGHKVFAPTLTGLGERSHLLSKDVNLDTHITDIVNVFKWEDLKDVCLVVHSYGGWPGSGALEAIGDCVSSIVWLDAFKPENGQRGLDTASAFSREGVEAAVARGEPDDGTHYYEHWLAALEKLVARKKLIAGDELEHRVDEWDTAARTTPHGKPIVLPPR